MRATVLNNPYPANSSPTFRLIQALSTGLFVFLFLIVFKPFQFDLLADKMVPAALGFGVVTFLAMVVMNLLIPFIFGTYFKEESWNVGREVFYTLLNIWLIGVLNFLFYNRFFHLDFGAGSFIFFQFSSVAIGVFPTIIYILVQENRRRHLFSEKAGRLNELMHERQLRSDQSNAITIPSMDNNEDLMLPASSLYFMRAADNYAEVFFKDPSLKKVLVRNTLKSIDAALERHDQVFRCHKSYIVNLDHVERISGNAQGYKLHLSGVDEVIPVSRQYNQMIRAKLTDRP